MPRFHTPASLAAEGEHDGFPWAIVINPGLGHFCAYVGVPKGHPWHGKHYDAVEGIDIHGGLTYSEPDDGGTYWLGWDYAHGGDWLAHRGDSTDKRWTLAEVTAHAIDACEQARRAAGIEYVEPAPRPAPNAEYEDWDRRLATILLEQPIPAHMHNGIRDYILHGLMPGGFLSAIFRHEFYRAWGQADNFNSRVFTAYFDLLIRLPAACHGSREAVEAWAKHQGLLFKERTP